MTEQIELLLEDKDERKMFDHATKNLYGGDPIENIMSILNVWKNMSPMGSYRDTLVIIINELRKNK